MLLTSFDSQIITSFIALSVVVVSLGKQTYPDVTNMSNVAQSLRGYAHLSHWVTLSKS